MKNEEPLKKKCHYEIFPIGPLRGEVEISGAKNAATKEIVASLLTKEVCVLDNAPNIEDTQLTLQMCRELGGKVDCRGRGRRIKIQTSKIKIPAVSQSYTGRNRIPILMIGPLLHRCGWARVPIVGGDEIGKRPVNFHFMALEKMGAKIERQNDEYLISADRLHGAEILLPYPSVGATENVLLSSVLAQGRTVLRNAAIEPEVIDLVMVLQKMGAIVEMREDRTYIIDGIDKLGGYDHQVITDRIEAASFACAAIASGGDVLVKGAEQRHMVTFLNKIRLVGGGIEVQKEGIRFFATKTPLKSISIETSTHPGFMTDWQQPFVVLLTQAHGESIVHETVFENRFEYVKELDKMGANIKLSTRCLGSLPCRFEGERFNHSAIIFGPTKLKGTKIEMPDIRAGFSYLLAAAIAKGKSTVFGVEHVERGYEKIAEKLQGLGVGVKIRGK